MNNGRGGRKVVTLGIRTILFVFRGLRIFRLPPSERRKRGLQVGWVPL
jgi:hypothetical protein